MKYLAIILGHSVDAERLYIKEERDNQYK